MVEFRALCSNNESSIALTQLGNLKESMINLVSHPRLLQTSLELERFSFLNREVF